MPSFKRSSVVAGAVLTLGLSLALVPSAEANVPNHVRISGQISCATWPPALPWSSYLASRARFQAANGEARDATISGLNYQVDLFQVPAGGENVTVYVTCQNFRNPSWGRTFRVNRQANQQQTVSLLTH